MPWFRVDDNLAFHHKVVAAGNAAIGLWVRAGALCANQLTDGFVPDHMISALGGSKQHAARLVSVGLWDTAEGGYRFHEWSERQPSKEHVEAEREAARQRMAERRRKRGQFVGSAPEVRPNTERSSGDVRPPRPDPTRPDPLEQPGASTDVEREFERWYDAYPRKRGRGQALKAYKAARKKTTAEALFEAVASQAQALTARGADFVPYPATWLNGERWDDQPDSNVRALRPDDQGRILLPPLPPSSPFGPA